MSCKLFSLAAVSLAIVAGFCSCSKSEYHIDQVNLIPSTSFRANLSSGDEVLSSNDALSVIRQVLAESPKTKAQGFLTEDCVIVINDKNQSPSVYAINMEDGFYLLSASKHYYPILAYVEHGQYPPKEDTGINIIVDEMVASITEAKADSALREKFQVWWEMFEESKIEITPNTKSTSSYSDYVNWLYSNYIPYWQSNGYSVYFLSHKPDNMPDSMYSQFCDDARDNMQYEPGFDYMYTAIILEKRTDYDHTFGPLCSTTWGRGSSYSSLCSNTLTDLSVALGQIMKCYQYPARHQDAVIQTEYHWSSMPNNSASLASCMLLRDINADILERTFNESPATLSQNTFSSVLGDVLFPFYGYTYTSRNHSVSATISDIQDGHPVLIRGKNSSNEYKHWICDGYRYGSYMYEYSLIFPIFDSGEVWDMEEYESQVSPNVAHYTLQHLNWGDSGNGDGYYIDSDMHVGSSYYTTDRRDFVIERY